MVQTGNTTTCPCLEPLCSLLCAFSNSNSIYLCSNALTKIIHIYIYKKKIIIKTPQYSSQRFFTVKPALPSTPVRRSTLPSINASYNLLPLLLTIFLSFLRFIFIQKFPTLIIGSCD